MTRATALFLYLSAAAGLHAQDISIQDAKKLLRAEQQAFVALAKQATPGVVYIEVERDQSDGFWDWFDGPRKSTASGSGVVVRADGLIVTNNHIVRGVKDCKVRLAGGLLTTGMVLGTDPATDIAVIKVQGSNLPIVKWGDSDKIQVGEWVMAVGNPFGLEKTVTTGIVSAKGRQGLGLLPLEDFIQTDAAINPGNSGGALVNIDGELVGINSMIFTQSGGSQGIGFAIPSNMVKKIADQIVQSGTIERGWIGFVPATTGEKGAWVYAIYRNSPANRASLQRGDQIVAYNDKNIGTAAELRALVVSDKPGKGAVLTIVRNGERSKVSVQLTKIPIREDGSIPQGL